MRWRRGVRGRWKWWGWRWCCQVSKRRCAVVVVWDVVVEDAGWGLNSHNLTQCSRRQVDATITTGRIVVNCSTIECYCSCDYIDSATLPITESEHSVPRSLRQQRGLGRKEMPSPNQGKVPRHASNDYFLEVFSTGGVRRKYKDSSRKQAHRIACCVRVDVGVADCNFSTVDVYPATLPHKGGCLLLVTSRKFL